MKSTVQFGFAILVFVLVSECHEWSAQTCKSGLAVRVKLGPGLSLSKCFGPISGLCTKVFDNMQCNDFFVRDIDLLC